MHRIIPTLLLFVSVYFIGCSSSATLNKVQTTNTYSNKLPLKAAVYVPSDFANRSISIHPSTSECGLWKADISAGNGYLSAVESGLSSALSQVTIVNAVPDQAEIKAKGYDVVVQVSLGNENSDVSVASGFLSGTVKGQFQVSFNLAFSDRNGQSLFSYSANGSGFSNESGSCNDLAPVAKKCMETALKQAADYIAQSTFSSSSIVEYSKTSAAGK